MKVRQDFQALAYRKLLIRVTEKRLATRKLTRKDTFNVELMTKPSDRIIVEYPPEMAFLWKAKHEDLFPSAVHRSRNRFLGGARFADDKARYFGIATLGALYRAGVLVGTAIRA